MQIVSFDKKVSILMNLEKDEPSIAFLAVQGVVEKLVYERVIVANEALQPKVRFSFLSCVYNRCYM